MAYNIMDIVIINTILELMAAAFEQAVKQRVFMIRF